MDTARQNVIEQHNHEEDHRPDGHTAERIEKLSDSRLVCHIDIVSRHTIQPQHQRRKQRQRQPRAGSIDKSPEPGIGIVQRTDHNKSGQSEQKHSGESRQIIGADITGPQYPAPLRFHGRITVTEPSGSIFIILDGNAALTSSRRASTT